MKRKLNKKTKKKATKKDLKNKLIAYRITEEQYDKASKLAHIYGMQPQEYARMLFVRQLPEEEKNLENQGLSKE